MIRIEQFDITTFTGDAIVNAANRSLLGGGGVDGAIHRAAGPGLLSYNKLLGGCNTAGARISPAFDLPCKLVISTVGPIYDEHTPDKAKVLLETAYYNVFSLAAACKCRSIALPAISCGVYGYPIPEAATVAIAAAQEFEKDFDEIVFALFTDECFNEYKRQLG